MTTNCPDCGLSHPTFESIPLIQRARPNGTLEPAEWSINRAANFTMPFGKHKGRRIACIAAEHPDYLEWAAMKEELPPSVRKAATIYLNHLADQGEPAALPSTATASSEA